MTTESITLRELSIGLSIKTARVLETLVKIRETMEEIDELGDKINLPTRFTEIVDRISRGREGKIAEGMEDIHRSVEGRTKQIDDKLEESRRRRAEMERRLEEIKEEQAAARARSEAMAQTLAEQAAREAIRREEPVRGEEAGKILEEAVGELEPIEVAKEFVKARSGASPTELMEIPEVKEIVKREGIPRALIKETPEVLEALKRWFEESFSEIKDIASEMKGQGKVATEQINEFLQDIESRVMGKRIRAIKEIVSTTVEEAEEEEEEIEKAELPTMVPEETTEEELETMVQLADILGKELEELEEPPPVEEIKPEEEPTIEPLEAVLPPEVEEEEEGAQFRRAGAKAMAGTEKEILAKEKILKEEIAQYIGKGELGKEPKEVIQQVSEKVMEAAEHLGLLEGRTGPLLPGSSKEATMSGYYSRGEGIIGGLGEMGPKLSTVMDMLRTMKTVDDVRYNALKMLLGEILALTKGKDIKKVEEKFDEFVRSIG